MNHLMELGKGIVACAKVTAQDIAEMQKLLEEEKKKQAANTPKEVPLPPCVMSTMLSCELYKGTDTRKRKEREVSSPLDKAFNTQGRNQLNAMIARFFYASGLPFHLARSPYYMSCFSYAANNSLAGYIPPGYNALRTSLLQQERANVERLLQPVKSTWVEKRISIVSDGWSDSQRRPLINFMAVSESGPMFLKAVDCSGQIKDKFFIFNLLKEVIKEVGGPQNVVQVITDNAKNCSSAGTLIEGLYPNIVWTPCVVHTLNLALQNICAAKNIENNQETFALCSWISDISADASMIKNFIMNHGMRLAIFNKFVPLKLLSVAATRFASILVMLKRMKLIKRSLQAMVISEQWDSYREDDVEKASFVKMKVLDDIWWDKVDYILSFTAPLYDMLRACDTDRPCLHLVYDMWDTMIEKVKNAIYKYEKIQPGDSSSFYDVVYAILVSRWNKNNTPLHCLAHSLNPR